MASEKLLAQVRLIVAARGTTECFAEVKRSITNKHPGNLGPGFWSTDIGKGWVSSTLFSLMEMEARMASKGSTDNILPSARNTGGTLLSDLEEILPYSDDLHKQRGFAYLATFMGAVVSSNDGDFAPWESLYNYLRYRFGVEIWSEDDDHIFVTINAVREQWGSDYVGQSLSALKDKLKNYHGEFEKGTDLYGRIMPIVQSSGTGKSRLVNELARSAFGILFTLRDGGSSGFPPADPEVVKFFKAHTAPDVASQHARIICFLGAAVSIATEEFPKVETTTRWREKMTPAHITRLAFDRSLPFSEVVAKMRSQFRKDFCSRVVKRAESTFATFKPDGKWIEIHAKREFNKLGETSFFEDTLGKPARELVNVLPETDVPGCRAFFVIDEVSLLNKIDGDLFPAIHRVLRSLKMLPIWTFFLDTASGPGILAPVVERDRVAQSRLQRVEPFFCLSMDVELGRRMEDPDLYWQELRKPLSEYGTAAHMSLFGRPLWAIYGQFGDLRARSAAEMKILGGNALFNPDSKDHVFALLASRVCLTPRIRNAGANELSRTAVSFHLRLISSVIDMQNGRTLTTTPSEPLVSEAAAYCLQGNWPPTIRAFTEQLLAPGLLDTGLGEELYARILFIMAKDATAEDARKNAATERMNFGLAYSRPVMLWDFVTKLFGKLLNELPSKFAAAFQNSRVNFNHFVNTDKLLDESSHAGLLHKLLYSHAALQLVGSQPYWDLLIPIYLGDPSKPFDATCVSSLIVQVKNRDHRRSEFPGEWGNFNEVNNCENPILFVQLEFGAAGKGIDYEVHEHVYAMRVKGKTRKTYSFMKPKAEKALVSMFTELTPYLEEGSKEKDIVVKYGRFHRHEWQPNGPECETSPLGG